MDAFASFTPLASILAAGLSPNRAILAVSLAHLAVTVYGLATAGDHHRATTLRLGGLRAGLGRPAVVVPVRVGGGGVGGRKARKVRRVVRPAGVGRGK